MMKKELPVFSHWYDVLGKILDRAGRFPKSLRPTLGNRLIDRGLDVMECIVRLRYTRERSALFREGNLALEQMRVLVRICFERRIVSGGQYEDLAEGIDACGRMLGGWSRSEKENQCMEGEARPTGRLSGRAPAEPWLPRS